MMNHSKTSIPYIHIQLMVAAMESLLTAEQSKRILTAAEWGGFDAGMKSLARASDQIKAAVLEVVADKDAEIERLNAEAMAAEDKHDKFQGRIIDLHLDDKISDEAFYPLFEDVDPESLDEQISGRADARERKKLSALTREELEALPETYLVACELNRRFDVPFSGRWLERIIMEHYI